MKEDSIKDFKRIPGVGAKIAEDLWELGYRRVEDLKDKDPHNMYEDLCNFQGCKVDRCMLYVFRCAVYFASAEKHNEALLKWWNWKD